MADSTDRPGEIPSFRRHFEAFEVTGEFIEKKPGEFIEDFSAGAERWGMCGFRVFFLAGRLGIHQ